MKRHCLCGWMVMWLISWPLFVFGQVGGGAPPPPRIPTLEIHQIDVGQADATLIKVNTRAGYPYMILIDAGNPDFAESVRMYVWDDSGPGRMKDTAYLDLVIASHYDRDHIGGFSGSGKYVGILTEYENDPNGYPIDFYGVVDPGPNPGPALPVGSNTPTNVYWNYANFAGLRRVDLGNINNNIDSVILLSPENPYPLPTKLNLRLGGHVFLGEDANHVPVRLRLIASNGYAYAPTNANRWAYEDVAQGKAERVPHNQKNDNNNWGLGWVLEYGAFRYFTGGDLCGTNDGKLLDMETPISNSISQIYPKPLAHPGHVCAMKANHHGSDHSSNQAFINRLSPVFFGVSCGEQDNFEHPRQAVIDRVLSTENSIPPRAKICDYFALTSLFFERDFPSKKLYISGSKCYVDTDDYQQFITDNVDHNIDIEDPEPHPTNHITGTKRKATPKYEPIFSNKAKVYGGIRQFDRQLWDTPPCDGDFILNVFPVNSNGDKILDKSSFQFVRKGLDCIWQPAELINCHEENAPAK